MFAELIWGGVGGKNENERNGTMRKISCFATVLKIVEIDAMEWEGIKGQQGWFSLPTANVYK